MRRLPDPLNAGPLAFPSLILSTDGLTAAYVDELVDREPTNGNGQSAVAVKTPCLPGTSDNSGVAAATAARDLKTQRDKEKAPV